jgi:hypothetical protein
VIRMAIMHPLDMPIGTEFYVPYGQWTGQIIEENGQKLLLVKEIDEKLELYRSQEAVDCDIILWAGEVVKHVEPTVKRERFLYNADPDCEHDIIPGDHYSGIKCSKCTGWFCL